MNKTEFAYVMHFGIVLVFNNGLIEQKSGFPFYSVLFNESLNSSLQQCQVNIHIRFWDEFKCEVTTQYLTWISDGSIKTI